MDTTHFSKQRNYVGIGGVAYDNVCNASRYVLHNSTFVQQTKTSVDNCSHNASFALKTNNVV